jgi:hypothetical protein
LQRHYVVKPTADGNNLHKKRENSSNLSAFLGKKPYISQHFVTSEAMCGSDKGRESAVKVYIHRNVRDKFERELFTQSTINSSITCCGKCFDSLRRIGCVSKNNEYAGSPNPPQPERPPRKIYRSDMLESSMIN